MAKLSQESKKIIGEGCTAFIATSSKKGQPNVSPKGSFRVLDNEHVGFMEMAPPPARTCSNLKENPQVSVMFFNQTTGKGCRIWGKAVEIAESGKLVEDFKAWLASKGAANVVPKYVVKIAVEEEIVL